MASYSVSEIRSDAERSIFDRGFARFSRHRFGINQQHSNLSATGGMLHPPLQNDGVDRALRVCDQ